MYITQTEINRKGIQKAMEPRTLYAEKLYAKSQLHARAVLTVT